MTNGKFEGKRDSKGKSEKTQEKQRQTEGRRIERWKERQRKGTVQKLDSWDREKRERGHLCW